MLETLGCALGLTGRELGSLDVILQREEHAPGECIAGVVMLHVVHAVSDVELSVEVRGSEHLHEIYRDGGKQTSEFQFLSLPYINLGRMSLEPGDLQIPFSVQLPSTIPVTHSTAYAIDTYAYRATLQIQYDVFCKLKVHDVVFGNLNQQLPFVVKPARPTVRAVGQAVEQRASCEFKYGFFEQGSCEVVVQLGSNVVPLGSTISAHVDLKLEPRDRLQHFTISLVRHIKPRHYLRPWKKESRVMKTETYRQWTLENKNSFELHLAVATSKIPANSLTLTGAYNLVTISYDVVIECRLKHFTKVVTTIPVVVVKSEHAVGPIPP